jgi:2-polyprenyl-3-methyl-5-hydroxy-6-metoxy-1,4-benzoquinol methylase
MQPHCRFCAAGLTTSFADLGMSPLSNAFVAPADLGRMEPFYPLHARVCPECMLVQLEQFQTPQQIFSDYAYFSSYSSSWLRHCEQYAGQMTERLGLHGSSRVVEIASNDGYLLQYFVARGIPVLGIEPAANVASAAVARGVATRVAFFGSGLARELAQQERADLVIANNVLAHVPDLNDFVAGLALLLKPAGLATLEFPHLLHLVEQVQFDTIYHEHFSYFSLAVVQRVFAAHGLALVDVEELPTHGGSLRVHARLAGDVPVSDRVLAVLERERAARLDRMETYAGFAAQVRRVKRSLLRFLIDAAQAGHRVMAYGAPAKGVTLLNYCGVRTDLIECTVDRSPHKQGLYLPGVHVPVYAPEHVFELRPDYLLILPWNLREEIMEQMAGIREWGGRFVVPLPLTRVLD